MTPTTKRYAAAVCMALGIAGCSAAGNLSGANDPRIAEVETAGAELRFLTHMTGYEQGASDADLLHLGYLTCQVIRDNRENAWAAIGVATYRTGVDANTVAHIVAAATTDLCPDLAHWVDV